MKDKLQNFIDGAAECLLGAFVGFVIVLVVVDTLGVLGFVYF